MTGVKLIAGNWKMNGLKAGIAELEALIAAPAPAGCELLLCPPATLVAAFAARARGSAIAIGGQDCHWLPSGAHTGDISADMLADAGASHVIVGHSERRADHGETDEQLRAKAEAELGEAFDIRGFHDTILGGGAMPLDLLEQRVDRWIASKKAG